MAEGKKSFILYADQIHLFEGLEDNEAGVLIKHLFRYVNDMNPECDKLTKIAFEPIKQQLKRDLIEWNKTSVNRSVSGHLGGIKSGETRRKQKEANEASALKSKQKEANEAVNVNDNVNVNAIKKKESDKSLSLENRKKDFMNSLIPFLDEFSKEMVRAFFDYWSEHNQDGFKMRFEMEKVFDRKKRLTTWRKRELTINKTTTQKEPPVIMHEVTNKMIYGI